MAKEIGNVAYRPGASEKLFVIKNPSSSSSKVYETIVWENGSVSCNCPGWTKHNTRTCKHTKEIVAKMQLVA